MILREVNGRKKGALLISPRSQNRVALIVSILQRCKSVYRVFESTRICPYLECETYHFRGSKCQDSL